MELKAGHCIETEIFFKKKKLSRICRIDSLESIRSSYLVGEHFWKCNQILVGVCM